MKGWGWVVVLVLAAVAGLVLRALDIEPDGSPGWLWGGAIMAGVMAAHAMNKAQENWPLEQGEPIPFEAVEHLALMAGAFAAAMVLMGLAGAGGLR